MERNIPTASPLVKHLRLLLGLLLPALMMQSACSQEAYLTFGEDTLTATPSNKPTGFKSS